MLLSKMQLDIGDGHSAAMTSSSAQASPQRPQRAWFAVAVLLNRVPAAGMQQPNTEAAALLADHTAVAQACSAAMVMHGDASDAQVSEGLG